MTTAQFLTRFTWLYLLLNLPVAHLLGVPIQWRLAFVFICLVSLAIFALVERKRSNNPDDVWQLIGFLTRERNTWTHLEKQWLGRTVRLKEDILNLREPEELRLYVQAGTPGTIVALNRDEYAPFTVKFPGFGHKVKVRLDKLDVPLDDGSAGNVPAQRRASLWKRLPARNSLLPTARLVDDEDDDDIPEDAELFVDEMSHFAAFDWHVWSEPHARRAYRQMRHGDN